MVFLRRRMRKCGRPEAGLRREFCCGLWREFFCGHCGRVWAVILAVWAVMGSGACPPVYAGEAVMGADTEMGIEGAQHPSDGAEGPPRQVDEEEAGSAEGAGTEEPWREDAEGDGQEVEAYLSLILGELGLDEVDRNMEAELPQRLTFGGLVQALMEDDVTAETLVDYVLDLFFYEIRTVRPMFIQILSVALLFAMFGKVLITRQGYVHDLSFFAVYSAVVMLLLNSFLLVNDVVEAGIQKMLSFMTAFIPVYATTLLVAGNGSTAGIFYEIAFVLIYLLELVIHTVFVPGVQIFVLLLMVDGMFEEARLSRLADMIESGIRAALKLAVAGVVGLGVVQSLLAPARDRLAASSVYQTLQAIPGVGNTFGAAGEVLVGCGIMIKNSVGAAALVILVILCAAPAVSVACFHIMYRLTGALLQPFCDRRLGECVHGVGRGCALYLKIVLNAMMLFFITVSMISASTGFIY